MFKKITFGIAFLSSMAILNGLAFADSNPTLHQVYQAAQSGKLGEAQGMMEKVLKEHPNSSKAHFVEAEILAKQGRLENAKIELNNAERLEPGLPFAKPQAVQELKSKIAATHQNQFSMNNVHAGTATGFPWGMLLLGIGSIVIITMVVRKMTSRIATPSVGNYQAGMPGTAGYPATGQPYPGGSVAPMATTSGGIGSNIVSGLVTGAAVGAGMVAGEALVHHFMDGNHNSGANSSAPVADTWNSSSNDMGGADFGVADNASWDDNANMADNMDIGGDDWS